MEKRFIGISELFEKSFAWYKSDWKRLVSIQAIPLAITLLATIFSRQFVNDPNPTGIALYSSLFGLLSLLAYGFSWLAIMWVVTKDDKKSTWKEFYSKSLVLAVPALVVGLLSALLTIGGFILLIIPGIYLAIAYSFSQYALFEDDKRGMDALNASRFYVKGYWWGVLGRSLVFGLAVGIISMILGAGSVGPQWEAIKNAAEQGVEPQVQTNLMLELIASAFSVLVVTPLSTIYTYLMYKSLREIKGEFVPQAK